MTGSTRTARSFVVLDAIREGIGGLVGTFDNAIALLGWPGVIAVAGALGAVFGGWRLALLAAGGFAALGILGLWESAMLTLSQMLAAVLISIVVGVPLGIIAGRSRRFRAFITPILDVMQIMPTFAYLAPMVLLFSIGVPSAAIATLIYAIPPAIRITALGIRGVPGETMEAAISLGSTRWQSLRKVQIPLARRTIGIGVNQTIMMALSMVVITALIQAPGLGRDVLRALIKVNVGEAFQAGIAIVILAIVLDRLTERASEFADPRFRRSDRTRTNQRLIYLGALGAVVVATLFARTLAEPNVFPESLRISFVAPINEIVDWFTSTFATAMAAIKDGFTIYILNPLEWVLVQSPFWLVLAVVGFCGWYLSGLRAGIVATVCLAVVILLGLWEHGMQTLATVLVATGATIAIGLFLGILSARSDRFRDIMRPGLDVAQTMPAFVYLIPAIALFDPSRFTAIVASVIYAVPPVIRLVDAGIRQVSDHRGGGSHRSGLHRAPAALEGPAPALATGDPGGLQPGHRHGPRDGRGRRAGRRRRARLRRGHRPLAARGFRQRLRRRDRDRAAGDHAGPDHAGCGWPPIDGSGSRGIAFDPAAAAARTGRDRGHRVGPGPPRRRRRVCIEHDRPGWRPGSRSWASSWPPVRPGADPAPRRAPGRAPARATRARSRSPSTRGSAPRPTWPS